MDLLIYRSLKLLSLFLKAFSTFINIISFIAISNQACILKYMVENILVADPDDLTTLKIVDFGLSAQLDNNYPKNVKCQCGTLLYMAP